MFDKKEYKATVKYYAIVILIAVLPIAFITSFIAGKVSPAVEWVIDFALLGLALLIGAILRDKVNKKQEAKKKEQEKDGYDPFK